MIIRLGWVLGVIVAVGSGDAQAETRTWIGGDGDWDDPSHWSDNTVPLPEDTALIANNQGTLIVRGPASPIAIANLSLGGLSTAQLVLQSAGQVTVTDSFFLGNTGVITGSGTIDAAAFTNLSSSSISPTGDLRFVKELTLNGTLDAGPHTITFDSGATFEGDTIIDGGLLTHPLDTPLNRFVFGDSSEISGRGEIRGRVSKGNLNATGDFEIGTPTDETYQYRLGTINTNAHTVIVHSINGTDGLTATLPSGGALIVPDVMNLGSIDFQGGKLVTDSLNEVVISSWETGTLEVNGRFGLQIGQGTRRDFLLANPNDLFVKEGVAIHVANHLSVVGGSGLSSVYTVHLNGGTLRAESLGFLGFSALDMQSGLLHITGANGLSIGALDFPSSHLTVVDGLSLRVDNTLHVAPAATLEYQGGDIDADIIQIENGGRFELASPYTNDTTLLLQGVSSRIQGDTLTNRGLLAGNGRVLSGVTNAAGGEIRVGAGNTLFFGGPTNTNAGKIELAGGNSFLVAEIDFDHPLVNAVDTGLIVVSGNSVLRFDGGLQNNGSLGVAFADTQIHGDITNDGTLRVNGGGRVLFNDDVHNDGSLSISADSTAVFFGTLDGANGTTGGGTVQVFGDLRPGNSPGAIGFGGNLELGPLATLEFEIGGVRAGTEYDQVHVAGRLDVGGVLDIQFTDGFVPYPGLRFNLLTFDSKTGAFDTTPGLNVFEDLILVLDEHEQSLDLVAAIPGDFDLNGQVDVTDLSIWATGFGTTDTVFQNGDADLNGQVDVADLSIWATRFGSIAADFLPLSAPILDTLNSASAIPEPSSLVLLSLGVLGVTRRNPPIRRPRERSSVARL